MKLSILSVFTVAVFAEEQKGGFRKLNQAKDMLAIKMGITDKEAKVLLRGYGCYCYPQNNNYVGPANGFNGEPVDELDRLCKQLYRAQRCLEIDSNNGEYPKICTVDQAYAYHQDNSGDIICGEENAPVKQDTRKECKIDMCNLEKDFVAKVSDLFNSGYSKNGAFDDMSETDYENTCTRLINAGGSPTELACCGTGIDRRTFNGLVNQCCNDQVSSLGSC